MSSLFNKYTDRGLSGLANIGNTCYLNSCMQVLSHTYELNHLLEKGDYKKKLNRLADSVLLIEWDKLRELLWSTNCTVAPYGFVKAVKRIAAIKQRDIFNGYGQNDVQEFLLFMIDCFHNALAREVEMQIKGTEQSQRDSLATKCYTMMKNMYKKEYSEMLTIFYGIHVSDIISLQTKESLSNTPEPFSILSLSIPDIHREATITIFDCFDLYCKPEPIEWINERTKEKEQAERAISFWSLPEIMILHLKRWNNNNTNKSKSNHLVTTPLTDVDFSKYISGYQPENYVYDLFGVCNHLGGASGGHYTAYIKNANGKWYECNDTEVKEINSENIISTHSYCLFYRKKNKHT